MEFNENETKEVAFRLKDNLNLTLSYTKTDKLITALFMVTEIMDKDEDIRIQLRKKGIEILSDINLSISKTDSKISILVKKINLVINLLDISSELGMLSAMNTNILKQEFLALKKSANEYLNTNKDQEYLENLFYDREETNQSQTKNKIFEITPPFYDNRQDENTTNSNGQDSLNIGLQTPGTLMDALKKLNKVVPSKVSTNENKSKPKTKTQNNLSKSYDKNNNNLAKTERRNEIIKTLKTNPKGLTISDIKSASKGQLSTLGEKTLQRELVAMVKDNILYKTGSKRWSKYFFKK